MGEVMNLDSKVLKFDKGDWCDLGVDDKDQHRGFDIIVPCADNVSPSLWKNDGVFDPDDDDDIFIQVEAIFKFHGERAVVKLYEDEPDPPFLQVIVQEPFVGKLHV